MAVTSNVGITLIEQGASQKEVTANAGLTDLDQFTGLLSKSVAAGGTINLTTDEAQNGVILLTGAPGSTVTVVEPTGINKRTYYRNDTTGGQTINVKKTSGGTTFAVPQGCLLALLSTTSAEVIRLGQEPVNITVNAATVTWTNQPAALTELFGLTDRRVPFDATRFTQARIAANVEVAGATGATLRCEFATTDGGAYGALDGGTGPNVLIDALGTKVGSWVTLVSGAKADVFLRVVGVGGDGAADPDLGLIAVQFR